MSSRCCVHYEFSPLHEIVDNEFFGLNKIVDPEIDKFFSRNQYIRPFLMLAVR